VSDLLVCACGSSWWRVDRLIQTPATPPAPVDPGHHPFARAVEVVLACANCGEPDPHAGDPGR
jgi:hypothetical protein